MRDAQYVFAVYRAGGSLEKGKRARPDRRRPKQTIGNGVCVSSVFLRKEPTAYKNTTDFEIRRAGLDFIFNILYNIYEAKSQ